MPCPPAIVHDMPERLSRGATTVFQAASGCRSRWAGAGCSSADSASMRPLCQGGRGVIRGLGLAPRPVLTPEGPCRLSHPRAPIGWCFEGRAQLLRPCPALERRAKQGIGPRRNSQTGVRVVAHPSPHEGAPGTRWSAPLFQHGAVRVPGVVAVVADSDHAEALRVDVR